MLQDHSRNRTPMPAAQPPAGAVRARPQRARAEAGITRMLSENAALKAPAQLPAPGSPEAIESFGAACRAVDLASLGDLTEIEALRINNGCTLWTSETVRQAQSGDYSHFNAADVEAAKAVPSARLDELLVMALRREMRMAEAVQASKLRQLYTLAFPDAESGIDAAPVVAAIRAHLSARAALNETLNPADKVAVREAGLSEDDLTRQWMIYNAADAREREAWRALFDLLPPSASDLARVMRYVANSPAFDDDWTDVRDGILSLAEVVERLVLGPRAGTSADAAFLALAPTILPKLDEMDRLWEISHTHYVRAHEAAGGEPDFDTASSAEFHRFQEKLKATPDWAAYLEARRPVDALDADTEKLIAPFMDVPVQTLDGLLLKQRIGKTKEHFENDAAEDLDRLLEARLADGSFLKAAAAPVPTSVPDPVYGLISEHRAAYAEWDRFAAVARGLVPSDPKYAAVQQAADAPGRRETAALDALIEARPKTLAGILALTEYLPSALRQVDPDLEETEGERALRNVAAALRPLMPASERNSPRDLSRLSTAQLSGLYEICWQQRDALLAVGCQPRCGEARRGIQNRNALGEIVLEESNRFGFLGDEIIHELKRRRPMNNEERDIILSERVRHALRCNDTIEPELVTEITAAWGAK